MVRACGIEGKRRQSRKKLCCVLFWPQLRQSAAQTKVLLCSEVLSSLEINQGHPSALITKEQTAEQLHQLTGIKLLECMFPWLLCLQLFLERWNQNPKFCYFKTNSTDRCSVFNTALPFGQCAAPRTLLLSGSLICCQRAHGGTLRECSHPFHQTHHRSGWLDWKKTKTDWQVSISCLVVT